MPLIPPHIPICIDGRMLVSGATGVGRYATMLLAALERIGGTPMVLTDAAAAGDRFGRTWAALSPRPRQVGPDGRFDAGAGRLAGRHLFRAAQERFTLTGRFLDIESAGPPGIMHWTYPVPLRMLGWHNLYTVHDVIPLEHPALSPVSARRLSAMLRKIARVAARVVTVSQASRAAIVSETGMSPHLVIDCGQAIEPIGDDAPQPDRFGSLRRGGYHLYCGLVEPRKNLVRLIEAHARSEVARPLVIAGPDGWHASRIRTDGVAHVVRLPYLSRPDLVALMRGAHALSFPSLAEGFGLPVVEAMNADVPVLTSNRGALAEVAGDAALLVDPDDVAAMAAGIRRIDRDGVLRAQLIERGRERRKKFTPALFAAALGQVYAEAIAGQARAD